MSFWTRLLRGATGDRYHRGIGLFNEGNYDEAARVLDRLDMPRVQGQDGSGVIALTEREAIELRAQAIKIATCNCGDCNFVVERSPIQIRLGGDPQVGATGQWRD